jgi:quercetin dioxygenase-like cupin family protein
VNSTKTTNIETAEIVLPCPKFDETFDFFTGRLGFQIISIFPADNPSVATVSGFGLRIRLEKTALNPAENKNIKIRLGCADPSLIAGEETNLTAPNGVQIEFVEANPPVSVPGLQNSFVLTRSAADSDWIKGRADMRYRDLIPDRQGGYVIASHIHIPKGGPVPDYVHFHKIRFQIIFCKSGWARLVYEDQGEEFIFESGDCVLQPPEIRHRVLECSDNLEVIEVSCPAEHETFADPEMTLPNSILNPERIFNGQNFVRHQANKNRWKKHRLNGFECQDTKIDKATKGFASVKVIRPKSDENSLTFEHNAEFLFIFILSGQVLFKPEDKPLENLKEGDSLVIPRGLRCLFSNSSSDLKMLEVSFLKEAETRPSGSVL